jgi:hypothetical protein
MEWLRRSKVVVAGCAIAAATACADSGNSRRETGEPGASANRDATRAEAGASPITVAGCLQKGDRSDFILTRINEPTESVGTTGANDLSARTGSAAEGTVERERLRSAAGAYRIDPADGLNLTELVGTEVRVVGTITENMDLPRANADRDPVQPKEGDLAEIEATSVSQTAAQCRGAESPAGAARSEPNKRR